SVYLCVLFVLSLGSWTQADWYSDTLDCDLDFTHSGDGQWLRDTSYKVAGSHSLYSSVGWYDHDVECRLETQVEGPGTIQFHWAVWSESGCDYLRFYVDGQEIDKISGDYSWTLFSAYPISSGTHTLRWAYTKDYSISESYDCGSIDAIVWTPTATNSAPSIPVLPQTVNGLTTGYVGHAVSVQTWSVDPDTGDQWYYTFDWGEGSDVNSLPVDTNDLYTMSHTYSVVGQYDVRVKATDANDAASDWSAILTLDISDPPANFPPEKPNTPVLQGNPAGEIEEDHTISVYTTDTDSTQLYYIINWGDGSDQVEQGLYNQGTYKYFTHKYSSSGIFNVSV
ncbi:MAG: PKD domain-containing protein, partial [Bacteroidales bacterium]|nr:PKD domain-containing protein [Bacteroidales bacterium]